MNSKSFKNYSKKVSSNLVLYKLWKNISKVRKRQVSLSFLLMLISGFAEIATLA